MRYVLPSLVRVLRPSSLLILIVLLAIFFRGYQVVERFEFAHDGDLYSWIVKDIVVDHHLRLIGQQTSTNGIFIGPLFYYLLIPFFLLTSMDPLGVLFFALLIGVTTTLSFYFVFKKLFDSTTGLIAAFLQAVLLVRIGDDRWVVPTITTNLWGIWYLYTILMLTRGNFTVFPLLGFLVAMIWHINFSLAPVLAVVPVAIIFSRKIPKSGDILKGLISLAVFSLPLVIFEVRHNFSQTKSFIGSFMIDQGGGSGLDKFSHVLQQVIGNVISLFFYPSRDLLIPGNLFLFFILASALLLLRKGGMDKKSLTTLFLWIFSLIFFFTFSSKIVSEYYFKIIETVILTFFILGLTLIYKVSKVGSAFILTLLAVILVRNILFITEDQGYSNKGYVERKEVVNFIAGDAKRKGFPCVVVSYIASPGENFGFRYLFYLAGLHVNQPKSGSPVYTIVSPQELALESAAHAYGALGVIPPKESYNLKEVAQSCEGEDHNLKDPLFGYTE